MSRSGAPTIDLTATGQAMHLALISASWHTEIMAGLRHGALRVAQEAGVRQLSEITVPGSFELPVAAARAAGTGPDAIVALGVVIRGGTPHFDYICQAATQGLTDVSVRTGVPIGFGVLTCADVDQARDRAGLVGSSEDKGGEAAEAAIATAMALRELPRS